MLRNICCRLGIRNLLKTQISRLSSGESIPTNNVNQGGFAKSYEKFEDINKETPQPVATFESLLRNSKFIELGDPQNKIVTGKIFHVVGDDLYIDFGWKFHCVCSRPRKNASGYIRGAKVRIAIKELELSSKFLGYEKDLTLMEADCVLLGLAQDRRYDREQYFNHVIEMPILNSFQDTNKIMEFYKISPFDEIVNI